MEDFWKRAKGFAEEAAKMSQSLTPSSAKISDLVSETAKRSIEFAEEAAKRSQSLTPSSAKISDLVSETAKRSIEFAEEAAKRSQSLTPSSAKISDLLSEAANRSIEFAAEASKTADLLKSAAIKQAGQLKSLPSDLIAVPPRLSAAPPSPEELLRFGINDDLVGFVGGLTSTTFQSFPVQDESEISESNVTTTASNVRKDLTEWQEKHATLVLTAAKQMSKLRYELCPRIMKERRFWKIYFTLVSSYVAPYEKQYVEEVKNKEAEQKKDDSMARSSMEGSVKEEDREKKLNTQTSKSSSAEQDLDTFLLGDLDDSDGGGPDDGEESFDDDFDKIDNSDVEDDNGKKK